MKTQEHAIKRCQEHATPAGGDITYVVKPRWPIRSLTKSFFTSFLSWLLILHFHVDERPNSVKNIIRH